MFKEALNNVLERVEGATGALIMGVDGIVVEKVLLSDGLEANLDIAAAEFTSLVRNAQRSGQEIGFGTLRELVIAFEQTNFIMRLFNRDYFVLLAMTPDGNLGRGRFELRKVELALAREFAL